MSSSSVQTLTQDIVDMDVLGMNQNSVSENDPKDVDMNNVSQLVSENDVCSVSGPSKNSQQELESATVPLETIDREALDSILGTSNTVDESLDIDMFDLKLFDETYQESPGIIKLVKKKSHWEVKT